MIDDLPTEKLDRAMSLRNGLVSLCEGRANMNDLVYRTLRREFLADPQAGSLVPQFVRTNQDTASVWAFFKDFSPRWEERRKFVRQEFMGLIDFLERVGSPNLEEPRSTAAPPIETRRPTLMYNLFVANDEESWQGKPCILDASRCVNEYTEPSIVERLGSLDHDAVNEIKSLPSIFAFEDHNNKDPKFGKVLEVTKRQGQVRIEYEIIPLNLFLSCEDLREMYFELDIKRLELHRTHWAIKQVDLSKELLPRGILIPESFAGAGRLIDIATHQFEVALSFPGEARQLVRGVADALRRRMGEHACFYDNNYKSQLARPSLDVLLQQIYRHQSKLVVVFISADYQHKDWCGIEFRAIREIIAERKNEKVMFIRTGDGRVDGVFSTDGYVDARTHTAEELAGFIYERARML